MERRDLLYEVYHKKISKKEALNIVNEYLNVDIVNPISDYLNIHLQTEWTALVLWEMDIKTVAKWRYEGWPKTCSLCNKSIDVHKDLWKAKKSIIIKGKRTKNVLVHQASVKCK